MIPLAIAAIFIWIFLVYILYRISARDSLLRIRIEGSDSGDTRANELSRTVEISIITDAPSPFSNGSTPPFATTPERSQLVKKNFFFRSISREESVKELSRLLAISRGNALEEGCSENMWLDCAELGGSGPIWGAMPSTNSHSIADSEYVKNENSRSKSSSPPVSPTSNAPKMTDAINVNETNSICKKLSQFQSHRPECSICLDHFSPNDTIAWAKDGGDNTGNIGYYSTYNNTSNNPSQACDHIFHEDCLIAWLQQHDECPLCRRRVVHDDAEIRFAGWEGQ
mmetsp:Transcript_7185/g.14429  ORF Transcript_7185/g.14429 Transcript_7185/m.14429 type:complete len:283 (+) Transcript_7185:65-913(+)